MLSFIAVCFLQTEKSRFLVFLKEKLCDTKPVGDLTKPDKEICNKSHQHTSRNQETTRQDCSDEDSKLGMEEESNGGRSELISKCLKLLMQKHILERVTSTGQVMMSEPCVFDVLTFLKGYIVHLCTVSERVVVEYLLFGYAMASQTVGGDSQVGFGVLPHGLQKWYLQKYYCSNDQY